MEIKTHILDAQEYFVRFVIDNEINLPSSRRIRRLHCMKVLYYKIYDEHMRYLIIDIVIILVLWVAVMTYVITQFIHDMESFMS